MTTTVPMQNAIHLQLEVFTKTFLALAAPAVILASVSYNYGFFVGFGLKFHEIPLSPSDHLQSWLFFLPGVIPYIMFCLILELALRRSEDGKNESEIVGLSSNPAKTRQRREAPFRVANWIAILAIIVWLLFGDKAQVNLYALVFLWFMFIDWAMASNLMLVRFRKLLLLSLVIPPLIYVSFVTGFLESSNALSKSKPDTSIRMKLAAGGETYRVSLLRSYDKWLLVAGIEKRLVWLRTDDVQTIDSGLGRKPVEGVLCLMFESMC